MSRLSQRRRISDPVAEQQLVGRAHKRSRSSDLADGQGDSERASKICLRRSARLAEPSLAIDERPLSKHLYSAPGVNKESVSARRRRRYLALKVAPVASMAPAGSSDISEKIVVTGQIQHFRKIQDDKVQLVVWQRPSIPTFMVSLADPHLPAYVLPHLKRTVKPDELGPILKSKTVKLAQAIGQSRTNDFIRDVCCLTKEFAAAINIHKVAVKLEHFGDNGCQYWHQDSVPYRLVATYRGPCTEWVHPNHGDATLRRRKDNTRHKQTFAHSHVPLFKGRGLSDSNDDTLLKHPGIVHRSPRILGSRIHRLVLVLNLPEKCC